MQVIMPTTSLRRCSRWSSNGEPLQLLDRTLIPKGMEDKLPEYHYTPYTTELTKELGQVVRAFPGDAGERGRAGAPFGTARAHGHIADPDGELYPLMDRGLGMYAMQAADLGLRKAGVLPDR